MPRDTVAASPLEWPAQRIRRRDLEKLVASGIAERIAAKHARYRPLVDQVLVAHPALFRTEEQLFLFCRRELQRQGNIVEFSDGLALRAHVRDAWAAHTTTGA